MKMRKIAKDKTGKVLKEGDIIHLNDGVAVIRKIEQPYRDEFPILVTYKVTLDWKGAVEKYNEEQLNINDYKLCTVIDGSKLRDDVQHFKNLKLISQTIHERMAYRHNVTG